MKGKTICNPSHFSTQESEQTPGEKGPNLQRIAKLSNGCFLTEQKTIEMSMFFMMVCNSSYNSYNGDRSRRSNGPVPLQPVVWQICDFSSPECNGCMYCKNYPSEAGKRELKMDIFFLFLNYMSVTKDCDKGYWKLTFFFDLFLREVSSRNGSFNGYTLVS